MKKEKSKNDKQVEKAVKKIKKLSVSLNNGQIKNVLIKVFDQMKDNKDSAIVFSYKCYDCGDIVDEKKVKSILVICKDCPDYVPEPEVIPDIPT